MPAKSSFLFLLFIIFSLALVACAPAATSTDQNTVATIVAAALTATQEVISSTQAVAIPSATQTLQVELTPSPTAPTILDSSTPTVPAELPVRIAYIKNGDVYLWTEGYGSIGLTDSHDAVDLRISGNGELIAYIRQDPVNIFFQELWLINTSSPSNPRVLVSNAELSALMPADPNLDIKGIGVLDFSWRPNTLDLAYNTVLLHEGPGFGPNHDLRLVNAINLAKATLFEIGQGGIFYYSPDGNQIALSNPESISLINADGSQLRPAVLTFPSVITYSEYQYHPHPIWAADSASLRVAIPPHDPLVDPLPATGLWLIPVDGSPSVLLGNIKAMPFAWPNNAFAPDLEHVIYAMPAGEPSANQRELHISSPDGSNDTLYDTGVSLEFKLWSPDSQHFIYEINRGTNEGLYLGMLDDQPVLISNDPHAIATIRWLDAQRFAYLLSNGSLWELRIKNLSGDDMAFIDTLPDSIPKFDILP